MYPIFGKRRDPKVEEKEVLLNEFKILHDEYLSLLVEYLNPTERKPMVEASLTKFNTLFGQFSRDEISAEELKNNINKLKKESSDQIYMRGVCTVDCYKNMLRAKDMIIGQAIDKHFPREGLFALAELASQFIADATAVMLEEANSTNPHWQCRDTVHQILTTTTKSLVELSDRVKEGKVETFIIPTKTDIKSGSFMN